MALIARYTLYGDDMQHPEKGEAVILEKGLVATEAIVKAAEVEMGPHDCIIVQEEGSIVFVRPAEPVKPWWDKQLGIS